MDEVKQTKIVKKSLKVAVNEPPIAEPLEPVNEPIEAPKVQKLTKKGNPDTRGKSTTATENLAKGRAKLEEVWAEKRKIKELLEQKALEKKVAKEIKLKKLINKQYDIESESEEEEEEEEVVVQPIAKKVKQPVVKVEPREKVIAPPVNKKKKVIKYVEVESESEEEEIVYVKKQKAKPEYVPMIKKPTLQNYVSPIQFF
jgi:hypothetical protein